MNGNATEMLGRSHWPRGSSANGEGGVGYYGIGGAIDGDASATGSRKGLAP